MFNCLTKASAALALPFVFLSCKQQIKSPDPIPRKNIGSWQLVADKQELKIPIDKQSKSTTYMLNDYFKQGDSAYIAVVHQEKMALNIYNLDSKSLYKRIQFSKDGPNGIGKYFFVSHFINYDFILVRGESPHKLYVMDSAGHIKRTMKIDFQGINKTRDAYFAPNGKPIVIGSKIYGLTLPNIDVKENNFKLHELPIYEYDLNEDTLKLITTVRYPAFMNKIESHFNICDIEIPFCDVKGKLVYGFPATDSLYVYDPNGNNVKQYATPSTEDFKFTEPLREFPQGEAVKMAKYQYLNYLLRYDPYNDVIYRFVFLPIEEDKEYNDYYRVMADKPITVQIIDAKDFTVKGETKLKAKEFYFQDTFVGEDGLYISNNAPSKADRDENFISYTRFKIVK